MDRRKEPRTWSKDWPNNLSKVRSSRRITVEELASFAGCGVSEIYNLQRGEDFPLFSKNSYRDGKKYGVGDLKPYVSNILDILCVEFEDVFPGYDKPNEFVSLEDYIALEGDLEDSFDFFSYVENQNDFSYVCGELFDRLSVRQREVLSLRYFEDLNLEDIACEFSITSAGVSACEQRALETLRRVFERNSELNDLALDLIGIRQKK